MNGMTANKQAYAIDLTRYSVGEMRIGPDSRGPSKCLKCQRTFRSGEVWQRFKSARDPEFGSYFIGVHAQCPARPGRQDKS